MRMPRPVTRGLLLLGLTAYTMYAAGPFAWIAAMSLRTTSEISANPYGLPGRLHWEKFATAWTTSNYGLYFWNSTAVVVSAVAALTIIGAMAAHCLARYRFRGNRLIYYVIFSAIIFPPQVTIISLFQVLVDYGLFNTRTGLTLVYISADLPLTMYILEGFFAQLPAGPLRFREDRRLL